MVGGALDERELRMAVPSSPRPRTRMFSGSGILNGG